MAMKDNFYKGGMQPRLLGPLIPALCNPHATCKERLTVGNCAVSGIIATAKMRMMVFIVFIAGLWTPISVPS